jgi:hypothetical protein
LLESPTLFGIFSAEIMMTPSLGASKIELRPAL